MNKDCCWNMTHAPKFGHNEDCFMLGRMTQRATVAVTFMDGETILYKNVRVAVNSKFHSGLTVDGTSLTFETYDETMFYLLGVRQYTYTLDI